MKLEQAIDDVEYYLRGMPESRFQDAIVRLLRFATKCQEISNSDNDNFAEVLELYEQEVRKE